MLQADQKNKKKTNYPESKEISIMHQPRTYWDALKIKVYASVIFFKLIKTHTTIFCLSYKPIAKESMIIDMLCRYSH